MYIYIHILCISCNITLLSSDPTLTQYSDTVSDTPFGSIYGSLRHICIHKYYINSDMLSGIFSDILSGIHSDILFGILSAIFSGIHSCILFGIYFDILSGIYFDILSDILPGII